MLRYKGRVFCFGWVLVFVLVLVEDFGFGFWLGVLCVAVVLNGSRLRLFGSVFDWYGNCMGKEARWQWRAGPKVCWALKSNRIESSRIDGNRWGGVALPGSAQPISTFFHSLD